MQPSSTADRRSFLKSLGAAAAVGVVGQASAQQSANAQPAAVPTQPIKLGMDNFSVRAMQWKATELIDYAAGLKLDSLFITDLDALEPHDEAHLQTIRAKAADAGLQIHVGTWSICPTSRTFRNKWGTAEDHLALGIRVAKAVGSPVIRVILGNGDDRKTVGGIAARMRDTAKVCQALRSRAIDSGVKIAIENHAGDMQSHELVALIEDAGRDYVGANIDSGNSVWTMEDPLESLNVLGPYVLTSSLRDSAIWESENGATVQWTAMGEGNIDWKTYFARFAKLCPGVPVHVETISGFNRDVPYLSREYWATWPDYSGREFARFVALARRGKPRAPFSPPAGVDRTAAEREYQKGELDRSIRYCKETLGLGLKH